MVRLILALLLHAAAASNEFGKKFLASNAGKDGVTTLPSGLQYKVLREGDGEFHPTADSECECHYEGRTAQEWSKSPQGKKFDSSYDRGSPTSFAPSGVIAGWTEAMQLMVEGDKWEMYIPSELGYGESGQGSDIGGGDVLVFTMEIIKIKGGKVEAQRGPPPFHTVTSVSELTALDEKHTAPLLLALLRKPLVGKLFDGFKAAARSAAKDQINTVYALSAESSYDGKTKKYTVSAVESELKLSAPGVFHSADGGKSWTKCATPKKLMAASVDDVKAAVRACGANLPGKAEL